MAGGQAGERTEKPTARRRQRAKDQGQFAYSQELTSAMTLAATLVTAYYYLQSPSGFRAFFASVLEDAATKDPSMVIRQTGIYFLAIAAPIFAAAVIAALAGNFLQGLPIFPHDSSMLKWEKLNPAQGLSRLKMQISWIQWLKLLFLV